MEGKKQLCCSICEWGHSFSILKKFSFLDAQPSCGRLIVPQHIHILVINYYDTSPNICRSSNETIWDLCYRVTDYLILHLVSIQITLKLAHGSKVIKMLSYINNCINEEFGWQRGKTFSCFFLIWKEWLYLLLIRLIVLSCTWRLLVQSCQHRISFT